MPLEAQDNPFPYITLVETADPSTPAANTKRLWLDTDGIIKEIDDAATVANVGGSGAPTTVDYLVGTASGSLSAEIVVGTTPGGELGGTWASPTVDATHSGSAHILDHTHAATGQDATGGGATLNPTTVNSQGLHRLTGTITSTVNADQNDFNPGSLHAITSILFSSFTANRTITGINAGSNGEVLILMNQTGFSLLLTNESASSSGGNRFRCPNNATHTVRANGSALLVYMNGRWNVIAA